MAANPSAPGPAPRRRLDLLLPGPRRSPLGLLVSVLLHATLLVLVIAPLTSDLSRVFAAGDSLTWRVGGGGGGGGVGYISLPAPRAFAEAARPRTAAPPRHQPVAARPPAAVPELPAPAPAPEPAIQASGEAAGDAAPGTDPGAGGAGGAGGGTGGGTGPGSGPGAGPGTGQGEGGRLVGPVPRRMVIPPQDPPKALRGREVRVTFAVDPEGQVTRVSIEPEIQDREYRERLLDAMRNYRFTPARGPDGTPVAGTYVVTVTL